MFDLRQDQIKMRESIQLMEQNLDKNQSMEKGVSSFTQNFHTISH
jgi:hypothetical protein